MKNKLIDKISLIYTQIEATEKDINTSFSKTDVVNKTDKLSIGVKVLKLQELNTEFFSTLDIFLNMADGTLDELPENPRKYYEQVEEMKKPVSETDPEEIKKLKEMINSYKKSNEN